MSYLCFFLYHPPLELENFLDHPLTEFVKGQPFPNLLNGTALTDFRILLWMLQHLQDIEVHILECTAWETGSPLYVVMETTDIIKLQMPPPSPSSARVMMNEGTTAGQLWVYLQAHIDAFKFSQCHLRCGGQRKMESFLVQLFYCEC